MPTRKFHTKEGSGINTRPQMKRSGGHSGLGMTPRKMRKSRRGRRY